MLSQLGSARMQNIRKCRKGFSCIYRTHGIVRRIYYDGFRARSYGRRKTFGIDLEGLLVSQNLNTDGTGVLNPHFILRKIRSDNDDLIARVNDCLKRH